MIILNLKGGLGNQMFQYALGRKLALKNNTALKLDISGYPRQTLRQYGLGDFNIVEEIATPEEVRKLKYPFGLCSKLARRFRFKILRRFHIGWEPGILEAGDNIYLDGFWQSYKYFDDVTETLKKEFTLKQPLSPASTELSAQILSADSISLHIRRGDYVSNPKTRKHHGICDLDYYRKAVKLITEKVPTPTFFVFSDDIDWVKQNLDIGFPTVYVSRPELGDSEELVLMSRCHHHIIANSSFSWWGAWLGINSEKIIISPTKWVNNNSVKMNDLIPKTWLKI